ncbi:MAG: hypothetical protein ORN98_09410 [Alphaproteobacteria bacterium]|nr:hypothetical protein [Alphaproteobacteria bacterium]
MCISAYPASLRVSGRQSFARYGRILYSLSPWLREAGGGVSRNARYIYSTLQAVPARARLAFLARSFLPAVTSTIKTVLAPSKSSITAPIHCLPYRGWRLIGTLNAIAKPWSSPNQWGNLPILMHGSGGKSKHPRGERFVYF